MRVIFFDIDTLRADHLGCYGYGRNTSPNIDAAAAEGIRFDNYYCPNAPCLPSRASLITGQFGIRTGVVGHGGTAADLRLQGYDRHFTDLYSENGLFMQFRRAGMKTASISTFGERHSSWWFHSGFNEIYNVGSRGHETADKVTPIALDWLDKNGAADDWFLHVHYWDPHTPYRTPADFGNPWENEPLPDDWITEEVFADHLMHVGPHGANEINMWNDWQNPELPRHPGSVKTMAEMKTFMDNYDCGIRYTDDAIGQIFAKLRDMGIYDDVSVIITSDHGENIGELGLYAEHGTADEPTCRIPMIIKWAGGVQGHVDTGFHTNVDLAPTIQQLLGTQMRGNYEYDGVSYADTLTDGTDCGQDHVILSQCAHVCQRSARFGDWLYIRTIHGGYHLFPKEMLFNIREDPHELHDLAAENPELCARGARMILEWEEAMMEKSWYDTDPLWTVMREGGPEHCRGELENYMERLKGTPREYGVELLKKQYARDLKKKS
ncbi:MAG: sulfatase [Ruminococcaceae bacterium]|nr:sulfatase [Oscillospiraceae bacterium]